MMGEKSILILSLAMMTMTTFRIPVMATWDDHDCCSNNLGNDFPCLK